MLDQYGREICYLRISVTELCNLRCRYCMPEEGICKKSHSEMLREEEMIQAVEAAALLGIRKVRITGGEPLVKKNILSICQHCGEVEGIETLCLTTNGVLLPQMAESLKKAGVKRVNISLDTLNPEKYRYITRTGELSQALSGVQAALEAGFEKVKLNTVLIGGFNEEEIPEMAELTRKYPIDVRFIEMMPMYDSGDFSQQAMIPCGKVLEVLPELKPEPDDGGVAKQYRFSDGKGCVGLISPVSAHFCGSCNRLRLTADGKLKPCLHSKEEYSIRGMGVEEMKKTMEQVIRNKPCWHGELSWKNRSHAGRNMNQIGG